MTSPDMDQTDAGQDADILLRHDVDGVATNLDLAHAIVTDTDFVGGHFDTDFINAHLPDLLAHQRPHNGTAARTNDPTDERQEQTILAGASAVLVAMSGVVVQIEVAPGDVVAAGATIAVVESMKMEHPVRASQSMRVDAVIAVVGDTVDEGAVFAYGVPAQHIETADGAVKAPDDQDWTAEVAEIARRRERAAEMGEPAKVERQRAAGKLTARERVEAISDPGSFGEIGALTGFARYDESGQADRGTGKENEVLGLDVAVENSLLVQDGEAFQAMLDDHREVLRREAPGEPVGQALDAERVGQDEVTVDHACVLEAQQARALDLRGEPGFVPEPLQEGVVSEVRVGNLEGDAETFDRIEGAIDVRVVALREEGLDAVLPEPGACAEAAGVSGDGR